MANNALIIAGLTLALVFSFVGFLGNVAYYRRISEEKTREWWVWLSFVGGYIIALIGVILLTLGFAPLAVCLKTGQGLGKQKTKTYYDFYWVGLILFIFAIIVILLGYIVDGLQIPGEVDTFDGRSYFLFGFFLGLIGGNLLSFSYSNNLGAALLKNKEQI